MKVLAKPIAAGAIAQAQPGNASPAKDGQAPHLPEIEMSTSGRTQCHAALDPTRRAARPRVPVPPRTGFGRHRYPKQMNENDLALSASCSWPARWAATRTKYTTFHSGPVGASTEPLGCMGRIKSQCYVWDLRSNLKAQSSIGRRYR